MNFNDTFYRDLLSSTGFHTNGGVVEVERGADSKTGTSGPSPTTSRSSATLRR